MGSSQTRPRNCVPFIGRQILNHCATRETQHDFFLCLLKLPLFLPNVAKLRLIYLQNKSGFNKLGFIIYISVIDHTGSFKVALLELFIKNLKLNFQKASQGQESHTKGLTSDSTYDIYRFGWTPLFSKSPKYPKIPVPARRQPFTFT